MPEKLANKFNEKINIPIAIPAWSVLSVIGTLLFFGGALSNKMDTVVEATKRNDQSIAEIRERQIGGLAAISNLQTTANSHEARISTLERNVIETKRATK